MSYSPLENAHSCQVGTVDYVSPDEIRVALDLEAPQNTALNAGGPRSFPRINGYLLVPAEDGFVVGQIEWLTVENASFPKRKGLQDFGLIDLPFPQRKLSLSPVGTLAAVSPQSPQGGFKFTRGVRSFPSIGDPVLLPSDRQLRDIVESGENRRVFIGTAPVAGNAEVRVDPDRLFGRHLAVLGNTGSGKSCTVAGLIQWSLDEARTEAAPNARFVILDPNGEYKNAFQEREVSYFVAEADPERKANQLKVPLWLWSSEEWATFSQAAARAQRPLLRKALRMIKNDQTLAEGDDVAAKVRRRLSNLCIDLRSDFALRAHVKQPTPFAGRLIAHGQNLAALADESPDLSLKLRKLGQDLKNLAEAQREPPKNGQISQWFKPFVDAPVESIIGEAQALVATIGGVVPQSAIGEDTPIRFDGAVLADLLEDLGEQEHVSQFVDFLVMRIRTLLGDVRMRKIIGNSADIALADWLKSFLGEGGAKAEQVTIIDLSLVPSEIVHLVAAVIARIIFEALQRFRKGHKEGKTLPTVLVMEEAHNFIRRYKEDSEEISSAAACCRVFEKIAREGRKFGLGLVLSSQRPSDLSPVVLSQCNSFLLHRLSNDKDQEAVARLLPDHLRGILRELPVLPTGNAFLLGWATELPVLTTIRELPRARQPLSEDPDFWNVWRRKDNFGQPIEREANWDRIAAEWQSPTDDEKPDTAESFGQENGEDEIPF